ncbi:MAG: dCTP deaminase [Halolamina sp.]
MTELRDRVDGIVHEPTQVHGGGVDLTLADVALVVEPGRLDFGGGEFEPAAFDPVKPTLRDPDDDYGWYDLNGSAYRVAFNESLTGDTPVRLRPREDLLACGATVPTRRTTALDPVPMTVVARAGDPVSDDSATIRLKENARIARIEPI